DPVVLDVISQLTTDAAIRADRVDCGIGGDEPRASCGHERAGRAGLYAFAAGHARALPHRVAQVEHDLGMMAAERIADDVVDLHFAAGAHAARALDAGVEINRNGRVRQVRPWRQTRCKTGLADLHTVNPIVQLGIGRIDLL